MKYLFYVSLVLIVLLVCEFSILLVESQEIVEVVVEFNLLEWYKNVIIYEVNFCYYIFEGMFNVFVVYLFCLKNMGIDIFWFMFIYLIFEVKCKGELGSLYVVVDYKDVNLDYGMMDDFKMLLDFIYSLGMYCIIDWVLNYMGWDNFWIIEYLDWYIQDKDGNIVDLQNLEMGEFWGWIDVVDLNYEVLEM